MTGPEFRRLLDTLASAWSTGDPDLGASLFSENATYMEPPDVQLFRGKDQLRAYFGAVSPGTYLRLHGVWFDESEQTGAAEFTFGVEGKEQATTGVFVVILRDDLIDEWREYHRRGPADFAGFTSPDKDNWEWHIGNYP